MPGEMTFRKDCEECGRSFLTPDKKAKNCQRCAGKGHEKLRPETVTPKGTTGQTQKSLGKSPISGPAEAHTQAPLNNIPIPLFHLMAQPPGLSR